MTFQSRSSRTEPNVCSNLEGVHIYVSVIWQGVFCQLAGDNSMEIEWHFEFLKGYHDVVWPGWVEGIAVVQGDDSTHPIGTLAAAYCCISYNPNGSVESGQAADLASRVIRTRTALPDICFPSEWNQPMYLPFCRKSFFLQICVKCPSKKIRTIQHFYGQVEYPM